MSRSYHFWKSSEYKYIEDNYQSLSDAKMAEHIGVSTCALTRRRIFLGFHRPHIGNISNLNKRSGTYTKTEYLSWKPGSNAAAFIRANWQDLSDQEMSDILKIGIVRLRRARARMGLVRPLITFFTSTNQPESKRKKQA